MATDVSICANALILLAENPINDFSEANTPGGLDRARIAENLWSSTRDSVLRSHTWNCAKTRVALSPEATAPAFGYTKRFVLPADWLRNVSINGYDADEVDYEVETIAGGGKRLLMDYETLNLVYIWKNTDVSTWDPMLVEACEYKMAAKMAYPITQDKELGNYWMGVYNNFIRQARTVDGQDESPQRFGSSLILEARRNP